MRWVRVLFMRTLQCNVMMVPTLCMFKSTSPWVWVPETTILMGTSVGSLRTSLGSCVLYDVENALFSLCHFYSFLSSWGPDDPSSDWICGILLNFPRLQACALFLPCSSHPVLEIHSCIFVPIISGRTVCSKSSLVFSLCPQSSQPAAVSCLLISQAWAAWLSLCWRYLSRI